MDSNARLHSIIAFDWGGTLMLDLPQYSGPMVDWPEVFAVEGAQTALAELSQQYRLIVATNAEASDMVKVRAALQRVGLADPIEDIFTSHRIKGKKPQPEFYRSIEMAFEKEADFAMVGDSFTTDVVGAWQAGWLAVWFNPTGVAAPGLMPLHDIEIRRLTDLPAALARPRLPGWNQAQAWLAEQKAPANLQLHIQAVSAVAYQLAVWLRSAGEQVDPLLAQRGAMLHDLTKISSLHTPGINHGEATARILEDRNQPALAEIARRHILTHLLDQNLAPRTWEEKAVFLADKLMEGSRLVPLEQRINALSRRYSRFSAGIQACLPPLRNLQKELCVHMHIPEAQLIDRLQDAMLGKA